MYQLTGLLLSIFLSISCFTAIQAQCMPDSSKIYYNFNSQTIEDALIRGVEAVKNRLKANNKNTKLIKRDWDTTKIHLRYIEYTGIRVILVTDYNSYNGNLIRLLKNTNRYCCINNISYPVFFSSDIRYTQTTGMPDGRVYTIKINDMNCIIDEGYR